MTTTINASTSSGLVTTPDNSGEIAFQNNGTTELTVNAFGIGLGTAVPSSGTGITFPAVKDPSSNANTLDDYEEGTWTPQLSNSGGSGSWSTRAGTYTKIGRLVICQFNFDGGNSGTAGGVLTLTGLPFTPASYTNTTVGIYGVNDDTSSTAYSGNILINGTTVMFYRGGASNGNRVSYAAGTLQFIV
jgi:hypothetical protein